MTKRNVTRIRITAINVDYRGWFLDSYMDKTLMLRHARKVGDEENVNHFVLGRLYEHQENGEIAFEKVEAEESHSGRDIKEMVEKLISDGMEKVAVVKKVVEMGIEQAMAEFMVNLYARKFNK